LDISPADLVGRILERIYEFDEELHTYITLNSNVRIQAQRLTSELKKGKSRGPLHGIPVSVKDLIDTRGIRTTYGSWLYANYVPRRDSAVVKSVKAHGALIIGKTNCDEFGLGIVTPSTRNPWDRTKIAGGSSGGSAAALAADLAVFALGTDTGGSIRIPASFCGVTGLKPTYGKIATAGVFPASWTMDHVGPMCRFASDLPLLLESMGYRITKSSIASHSNVALLMDFFHRAPPRTRHAITRCLDKLVSENIIQLTEISVPNIDELFAASETIDAAEVAFVHANPFSCSRAIYAQSSRQLIETGMKVTPSDYVAAQATRCRITRDLSNLTKKHPILITPSVLAQVPTIRRAVALSASEYYSFIASLEVFNSVGWPSLVIPVGFSDGLPIGIQFIGQTGRDNLVISLASEYQKISEWHMMAPSLFGELEV
jgi:Asp-tRNA(Asn)/Glu-tRNA(Gln) amidotransferase A subunit family amidase